MVGDTRQHLAQIGFGIETVELRRTDQAVDDGGAFPAASTTISLLFSSVYKHISIIVPFVYHCFGSRCSEV
jgi:hypothetical protein